MRRMASAAAAKKWPRPSQSCACSPQTSGSNSAAAFGSPASMADRISVTSAMTGESTRRQPVEQTGPRAICRNAPRPNLLRSDTLAQRPRVSRSAVEAPVLGRYRAAVSISFPALDRRWRPHDAKRDATADRRVHRDDGRWPRSRPMQTNLDAAVDRYLRAKTVARGTRNEYLSTLRKWEQWGGGVPIEQLQRKDVREFLDWVHQRAVEHEGTNPGRTANKAREHLRAVLSWAWEQ